MIVVSLGDKAKANEETRPRLTDEASATSEPLHKDKRVVGDEERRELLSRAHVWRRPSIPISRATFMNLNLDELSCKLKVSDVGGTTPKFDCELDTGQEIRIKYGPGREVPAEAATTGS